MKLWTLLLLLLSFPLHAAEPAFLQLHVEPEMSAVHPQHDRLTLRLQINRPDGSPVHAALVHARLKAPPSSWLASTDFPVVEDSVLFDSKVQIDNGEFTFAFVPPIRGVYTLNVDVSPLPGDSSFAPSHLRWQTAITENPAKVRNLTILLLILTAIGGISGYTIARGALPARIAFPAWLAAALLIPTLVPEPAAAHGDGHGVTQVTTAPLVESSEKGDKVELQMLTRNPRVGEPALLKARFVDAQGLPKAARFRLRFLQLEHGTEVFYTEAVAADGVLQWNGQFYDGSDHRVEIDALPIDVDFDERRPAHAEQTIAVEAISPPLSAVIKSFGLLMLVTAAAMGLGIMLGRSLRKSEDYSY